MTFNKSFFSQLFASVIYSLVPKEGYGCTCTPRLCRCKESHDSTFGESINPKETCLTDWLFSVHKIIAKFGYDPKKRHDHTFGKRLNPKESHGSSYWQCIGPNVSPVQNESHMSL